MQIELTNGRRFLVKVTYKNHPKSTFIRDEYGREVYRSWNERDTLVFVSEWENSQPDAMVKFIGIAHCSYRDVFKKSVGRKIAYLKALRKMVEVGVIKGEELAEMTSYDLDSGEYIVPNEN